MASAVAATTATPAVDRIASGETSSHFERDNVEETRPADRAAALQKAFMDMWKDPDLLAEAEKLGIGITPIDGKAVLALIDKIAATPQVQLDRVRTLLDEGKGAK